MDVKQISEVGGQRSDEALKPCPVCGGDPSERKQFAEIIGRLKQRGLITQEDVDRLEREGTHDVAGREAGGHVHFDLEDDLIIQYLDEFAVDVTETSKPYDEILDEHACILTAYMNGKVVAKMEVSHGG